MLAAKEYEEAKEYAYSKLNEDSLIKKARQRAYSDIKKSHEAAAERTPVTALSDMDIEATDKREALTTGTSLDEVFTFPSGYYVICANPGTGKGWFATWLVKKFYERHKKQSVFFSLEMSVRMVLDRIMQQWSHLTLKQLEDGAKIDTLLIRQDILTVDPWGHNDAAYQTPENFEKDVEAYYAEGRRIFMFDHLHELEGSTSPDSYFELVEKWAKVFQKICKNHPDIWLFIFAQPNGSAAKKVLINKTDIYGSKTITQKCEVFMSLNRIVNIDEKTGMVQMDNNDRRVIFFVDKNRLSGIQNVAHALYLSKT